MKEEIWHLITQLHKDLPLFIKILLYTIVKFSYFILYVESTNVHSLIWNDNFDKLYPYKSR